MKADPRTAFALLAGALGTGLACLAALVSLLCGMPWLAFSAACYATLMAWLTFLYRRAQEDPHG